jgi:uncharacterized protein YdaU (DUF1376 family)
VNHYPHHIGDFRSGTVNMTRVERWIYRDLLDVYYDKEQPLPLDLEVVCREVGVRSDEERGIVADILKYKFVRTDAGYEHERCESVIADYRLKADIAKENGKKGAASRYKNDEYMPTEGTLYAVRFSPEGIKIGVTSNMKSRLNQLRGKYGKHAFVVHQVTVAHMGDAEAEVLAAYERTRSGEEIPVAEGDESPLVSLMDRLRFANSSSVGRMPVASASPTNQEPITNNQTTTKPKNTRAPRFDAQAHLVSLGVDPKVARDWLRIRKEKRLAPTETAFEAVVDEAKKAAISMNDALLACCKRGWGGFEAKWLSAKPLSLVPTSKQSRHSGFDNIDYHEGVNNDGSF